MKSETKYEWCYETVDEHGDIIDSDFQDKLFQFSKPRMTDTLCLIRRTGNEIDGEQERQYAYVKDGKLPECFEDGTGNEYPNMKVPTRFLIELNNWNELTT